MSKESSLNTNLKVLFVGKSFILGVCKCPCKEQISVRTKKGLLQRIKHGHNWKIRENNPSKRGAESHLWKGGLIYDDDDYQIRYMPDHPFCNGIGYVREHRLIMEAHLNRYLTRKEVVHHINGIKDDNRLENLMLLNNQSEHASVDLIGKRNAKKDMSDRRCSDPECKQPTLTYKNRSGYEYWYNDNNGGFICATCFSRKKKRLLRSKKK